MQKLESLAPPTVVPANSNFVSGATHFKQIEHTGYAEAYTIFAVVVHGMFHVQTGQPLCHVTRNPKRRVTTQPPSA